MYGFFTPRCYEFVDTDDNFKCSCGCQVLMTSPANLRSLESQAQGKARLCSECIKNKPVPEVVVLSFDGARAEWIPIGC